MKLSEVSDAVLLNYMRLDPEYASSEDKAFANACKSAAVFYVKDNCHIDDEYIEDHEDITIAVLVLAADMFDRRNIYAESVNQNMTVMSILSHHDFNLVEGMEDEQQ